MYVPSLICSQTHPKDFWLGELEAELISYPISCLLCLCKKGTRVVSQCREGKAQGHCGVLALQDHILDGLNLAKAGGTLDG